MDSTLTTSGAVDNLILLYGDFRQFATTAGKEARRSRTLR